MKNSFGRGTTLSLVDLRSPWLSTTYKSWDDPPSFSPFPPFSNIPTHQHHRVTVAVCARIRDTKLKIQVAAKEPKNGPLGPARLRSWLYYGICEGWHPTQLYGDYIKPWNKDPYKPTRISWKVGGFFSWLICHVDVLAAGWDGVYSMVSGRSKEIRLI